MQNYEQWTRDEIARLRAEADKATLESATLQRTLDRWLASQGSQVELLSAVDASAQPVKNVTRIRGKAQAAHGDKNATAYEIISASPHGMSTDELYRVFSERFGAAYKRSSMRALLWHQKKIGKIDLRDGRYVAVQRELNG